jgi:hypothetical protein
LCSDHLILLINDRCDVQILMGIDAANNATWAFVIVIAIPVSGFDQHEWLRRTECADGTVTRP